MYGHPLRHLAQLHEKLSEKTRNERNSSGMRIALGRACVPCQIFPDRNRAEHVRLQFWHDDAQTGGGATEAEKASLLDQTIQDRSRASRHGAQQVNHHMQRAIKGLDLSLQSHMHWQGMQDLSQNQRDPHLDHDQFWASRPPDLQAQLACEQLEGQCTIEA